MASKSLRAAPWVLTLLSPLSLAQTAEPPTSVDFVVADIKVVGLQRISEGTVYNYLPVSLGDRLDHQRVDEALKALYATGFFRDVELRKDGSTLVISVRERPSIESFEIKGNKDIKTEELEKSLKNVGLAAGKTFDRSVLEDVKQYLTDQYFSRGKYAVRINETVDDQPGNKVKISIDIKEGKRAVIRQINFAGGSKFSAKEIIQTMELHTPNWLSWYKQDDRYSRESLQGDLEKIKSYYMDRGYADFQIDSTQVAIAPEKDDIYITVNVTEGDVYKLGELKLAGTMVVPEEELKKFIFVKPGEIYSKKKLTTIQEYMQYRLGAEGYAFAKIDPVPTLDKDKKVVGITFFIEPGNRVYVRHINFNGVTSINDDTLRREMRQLEGAWLSNQAVDRSKQRLQRLPFIEKVETKNEPVAGTPDLVDVNFDIKEGLPGQYGASIGYSAAQKLVLSGNFVQSNFLGTGERVSAEISEGRFSTIYNISQTDPYTTVDGVARTLSAVYRKSTQFVSGASKFETKMLTMGVDYGYPISEFQGLHWGVNFSSVNLLANSQGSSLQSVEWVRNNGSPYVETGTQIDSTGTTSTYDFYGTRFNDVTAVAGWSYDSRNRAIFADRGMRSSFQVSAVLPIGSVRYYTAAFNFVKLEGLPKHFALAYKLNLEYGNSYGGVDKGLPPFLQFYGGGPDTVRGFKESFLGPRDQYGNPSGGNLLTVGNVELLFPTPEKWQANVRASWFYDIGNVFSTCCVNYVGIDRATPVDYKFSYNQLKRSTGIAVQWLAPMGIFRFSYAFPLNVSPGDGIHYPDQREGFQFSVGSAF